MSATAVLLCGDAELDPDALGLQYAIVPHLCEDAGAAAVAARRAGADRVVLGLCREWATSDHETALRRGGLAPFGVESVVIGDRPASEASLLIKAAAARLQALPEGERGRPSRPSGKMSRRALFSLATTGEHDTVAVIEQDVCAGISSCGLCVGACPARAIDGDGPTPSIDAAACTACGECVSSCPQGAVRLAGTSLAQVEAQLEELLPGVDGIIFACRDARTIAPAGWALVELPTLALVTPGWILQVRSRGVAVKLIACDQERCAAAHGIESLVAEIMVDLTPRSPRPETPIRLREPLATSESLARLDGGRSAPVIEHPASPLGVVEFDAERCTLCGACGTACPTTALTLDEAPAVTSLRHDPSACVGCRRCVAACPESALEIRRGIDPVRLAHGRSTLLRLARERCAACGAELLPRPMRRRVAELLGHPDPPLDLCSRCALTPVRSRT